MIEHMDLHSGFYSVVATFLLVVMTATYVFLTYRLVRETAQLREAQTQPHIHAAIIPSATHGATVSLEISNVGFAPAYDIKLTAEPESIHSGRAGPAAKPIQLSALGPFRHGIPCLAPNARLELPLEILTFGWTPPETELQITASFKDYSGHARCVTYHLGFRHLEGIAWPHDEALREIARQIGEVANRLRPASR